MSNSFNDFENIYNELKVKKLEELSIEILLNIY